jgi:ATP-dependent Clp protease, protease subunit
MTVELLQQRYLNLYNHVRQQAIEDERARFKGLQDLEIPGAESIINKARYETGQSAIDISMQVLDILRAESVKQNGTGFH